MKKEEINQILSDLEETKERNMVIVDYGNVQKWEVGLRWKIDIRQLGNLVKHFSTGKRFLRRFYYGSDYGKNMAYVLKYLKETHRKGCIVFGARGHIGKELYDAKLQGMVDKILYAEDFEYRLNMNRFR